MIIVHMCFHYFIEIYKFKMYVLSNYTSLDLGTTDCDLTIDYIFSFYSIVDINITQLRRYLIYLIDPIYFHFKSFLSLSFLQV